MLRKKSDIFVKLYSRSKKGFLSFFMKEVISFNVKRLFYGKRSLPLNINGAVKHKTSGSNVYSQLYLRTLVFENIFFWSCFLPGLSTNITEKEGAGQCPLLWADSKAVCKLQAVTLAHQPSPWAEAEGTVLVQSWEEKGKWGCCCYLQQPNGSI